MSSTSSSCGNKSSFDIALDGEVTVNVSQAQIVRAALIRMHQTWTQPRPSRLKSSRILVTSY